MWSVVCELFVMSRVPLSVRGMVLVFLSSMYNRSHRYFIVLVLDGEGWCHWSSANLASERARHGAVISLCERVSRASQEDILESYFSIILYAYVEDTSVFMDSEKFRRQATSMPSWTPTTTAVLLRTRRILLYPAQNRLWAYFTGYSSAHR